MAQLKICKGCGHKYAPGPYDKPFQRWCGVDCGITVAREAQDKQRQKARSKAQKAERKQLQDRRKALKTKSAWTAEAQTAFNGYIRARDHGKPCISCGQYEQDRFTGGHFDCGHYRSTGAAAHLRFHTLNAHGQCKHCNRDLSGNVVEYRKGLIDRIGQDRVEQLENDNTIKSCDIEYLERLKKLFNKRARQYRNRRINQ